MIIFKNSPDIRKYLSRTKRNDKIVGFVPTMGALHAGHLSLIESCEKESDLSICSIFVNPTQFNDPKDFEKYPITIESDIYKLETKGCDVLFLPDVNEIYSDARLVHYDLGPIDSILEGIYRPGHFQGVCQAVHKLLEIVQPNKLWLGQKDYQQCAVIKKLINLIGFSEKVEIRIHPTVREPDGLAMSSRNLRLNEENRKKATAINEALTTIKQNLNKDDLDQLKIRAKNILERNDFKIDYVEIADQETLQPVEVWDGKKKVVGLIAASLDEVRLIDNLFLN